ncbi:MAG: ung [Phenylobacterium sp.]|jgi:uracil-DNA glycosylase|nr:ung [Phenylobacterium sp.]
MPSWEEFIDSNSELLISEKWGILTVLRSVDQKYLPRESQIFKILRLLPLHEVRVVMVGQSPYPDPRDACGIPFISGSNRTTKSLSVLLTEAGANHHIDHNEAVRGWIRQGVLLLNAAMTIGIEGAPGEEYLRDHGNMWKEFILSLLEYITTNVKDVPVVLMGRDAWSLEESAKTPHIIKVPHPVARNDSFRGCGVFDKVNEVLETRINWF